MNIFERRMISDFGKFEISPDNDTWHVIIGDQIPQGDRKTWLNVMQKVQISFTPRIYDTYRYLMEQWNGSMVCFLMVDEARKFIKVPYYRRNRLANAQLIFSDGSTYGQILFGLYHASGQLGLIDVAYYMHGPCDGKHVTDTTYGQIPVVVGADYQEASEVLSKRYSELFNEQVGVKLFVTGPK